MLSPALYLHPVGFVTCPRQTATDDDWGRIGASITLDSAHFTPDALAGLNDYSHIEVLFTFHLVAADTVETGARHPRGRTDWPKVGIFAQRGKNRPNRIGASICELTGVEGLTVHVRGLDAIDGTPVLDIKPVMREFLPRTPVRQPDWATELMKEYWIKSSDGL